MRVFRVLVKYCLPAAHLSEDYAMRFHELRFSPVLDLDADDQLSLPFADAPDPPDPSPLTHRQLLDFGGRRTRTYELVVHQDPVTGHVLAYCLRRVTKH